MKSKHNEEFVYQAVLSGEMVIEDDGSIWLVRKRGWDRWQGCAVSRPCLCVSTERPFAGYLHAIAADFPVGFKALSKIARGDRWATTLSRMNEGE